MIHLPTALGLKVCEDYIIEEGTRSVTLINCYRKYQARAFPVRAYPLAVCAFLADGLGQVELSLVIYHLATMEEIFIKSWQVIFADPLQEIWFIGRLSKCSFLEPGKHQVVLRANGEFVAQCTLQVTLVE